jgi:hypothetical protein
MVTLPSHFEMRNRSLPGDWQGGDLVPGCPLADAAQRCPYAFRCWSCYGLCSEPEQIDAHWEQGRTRTACTGVVRPCDVDRFSTGQRRSFGLAKRFDDKTALCSGREQPQKECDAIRAGMQDLFLRGPKADGEIERIGQFSFVLYVSFWLSLHRLVRASVRKSNLIC